MNESKIEDVDLLSRLQHQKRITSTKELGERIRRLIWGLSGVKKNKKEKLKASFNSENRREILVAYRWAWRLGLFRTQF
jgi:hypothetical protein